MGEAEKLRRRRAIFRRRRKRTVSPDGSMSVVDHLRELRGRFIFSLGAFFVIAVALFFFYDPLLDMLRRPLCDLERTNPELLGPQGCRLVFIRATGGFQFRLKLTALFAIASSSPVWLYQLYAFVIPALTPKERRYIVPFVATSTTLFLAGITMAYLVLPTGIRVLIQIGGSGLVPFLGAEEYLDFVGLMLLGFGVMFQLPIVLFFLGLAGVLPVQTLRRQRRIAIVVIVALSAIVTPTQDPFTLLILSVPLYAMYELTIVGLAFALRRRARRKAEEDSQV
jgi:sec-independent protein translocase protein TatC